LAGSLGFIASFVASAALVAASFVASVASFAASFVAWAALVAASFALSAASAAAFFASAAALLESWPQAASVVAAARRSQNNEKTGIHQPLLCGDSGMTEWPPKDTPRGAISLES
jgi:hypothetical protein